MSKQETPYLERLNRELEVRCGKNPRYSLRAFARALKTDAGTVSKVLSGRQVPSLKLSLRLADQLALAPHERQTFLASVAERQRSRNLQRISPWLRSAPVHTPAVNSGMELFHLHAEWYHAAILELTFTPKFQSDARWIAKQLGITALEAKLAVQRLLDFGLLNEKNGRWTKSHEQITTLDKSTTTAALKKGQRQFLEKAIESLENDPVENRSIGAMTMAIDIRKMPQAKRLISEFNRQMCALMETGSRKDVYNLQVSFYPLQNKIRGKSK